LKTWVENTGNDTLNISLEHWYILVAELRTRDWSPPEIGDPLDRRPIKVKYQHRAVWAIPANPERAFDIIPGQAGVGTFATHWAGYSLAPTQSFHPPLTDKTRGVLVFYMPKASARGVVGLAYMRGRHPVVVCPEESWGKRLPALAF
jgi:hypothetical protein